MEVSVPESITTPEGVTFRPNLLATTSFDGSIATTFKRTVTDTVCDNTRELALAEQGQTYKVKHSRYSHAKLADARAALAMVHTLADDFAHEVATLCATTVTPAQWHRFLDAHVPRVDAATQSSPHRPRAGAGGPETRRPQPALPLRPPRRPVGRHRPRRRQGRQHLRTPRKHRPRRHPPGAEHAPHRHRRLRPTGSHHSADSPRRSRVIPSRGGGHRATPGEMGHFCVTAASRAVASPDLVKRGPMNERRLRTVIQQELSLGPRSLDALLLAAQRQGMRTADLGTVWEICQSYGLGDVQGDRVVPHGWVEEPTAPEHPPQGRTVATRRVASAPGGDGDTERARRDLPPVVRSEIDRLRRQLALSELPSPTKATTGLKAWSRAVTEIKTALQQENAAASRQRVLQAIELEDGIVVSETSQRHILRFDAITDPNVAEGTQATLTVDGDDYDVDVISIFGSSITLAAAPGTPAASTAKLRIDLSWLIRAQLRRISELQDGGPGFNPVTALEVLGGRQPRRTESVPVRRRASLNDAQNRAVAHALGDGLTWLWGPPGTGKTTTVAAVVAELLRRRQRVLLAAPTNAAVDVAFQAVLQQVRRRTVGELVRLGYPADTDLVEHAGGIVLVDEVAAVRGAPVASRLQEVNLETRRLRKELKAMRAQNTLSAKQRCQWDRIDIRLAELTALRSELHRLMKAVRGEVCLQARLVAATSHQVFLETLKDVSFDAVVLDEGSMMTAALAALVAGTSTNRVLVAGDFRQLPPVVQADSAEASRWLRSSPFERAGVARDLEAGRWPRNLVALAEQHRMRPAISDLVSGVFYPDSPLSVAASVKRRPRPALPTWGRAEIQLIDTSGLASRVMRRQGRYSRFNVPHAQLVAALLDSTPGSEMGIISPFAPQARLLAALLPPDEPSRIASTVHRFQGAERDLVVFDTVDTGRGIDKVHPWLATGDLQDTGPRLLNVAISRARESLLVVADLGALADPRRVTGTQAKFMATLQTTARPIGWTSLLSSGPATTRLLHGHVGHQVLAEDLRQASWVEMRWDPIDGATLFRLLADPQVLQALATLNDQATVWMEPDRAGKLTDDSRPRIRHRRQCAAGYPDRRNGRGHRPLCLVQPARATR